MRFGESDRNPLALQTNLLYEGRWGDHPETYRLVGLPQGTPPRSFSTHMFSARVEVFTPILNQDR
jgi:hypothetical protein